MDPFALNGGSLTGGVRRQGCAGVSFRNFCQRFRTSGFRRLLYPNGPAGGRIATGQHLVYAQDSPLADLWVSMLDAFGTPVERFADSVGPARGVLNSPTTEPPKKA